MNTSTQAANVASISSKEAKKQSLVAKFAQRFSIDGAKLLSILKQPLSSKKLVKVKLPMIKWRRY